MDTIHVRYDFGESRAYENLKNQKALNNLWAIEETPMHDNLDKDDMSKVQKLLARRVYHQPCLQIFGKLYLQTQGTGGDVGDAGNQTMMMSDRSVKENIVQIDSHSLGIGLYLFDYKPEFRDAWGYGRQFGVMADEVERVMPEAVSVHPDGYKMVDYVMLGISRNLH